LWEGQKTEVVMNRVVMLLLIVLASSAAKAADSRCPLSEQGACLSVAQLDAAAIALVQFRKDQPGADPRNVFVSVSESDREFKVAFLPKPNPSEIGHDGPTDYITMDNPKGNQYGRFVEYQISKKLKKIVATIYAR
jgi:hypothetical protein